jgi:catechol 1,2-dioxygenase
MSNLKTILFYMLGAALLIAVTTLFRVDEDSELAASFVLTATPTQIPTPTATRPRPTRVRIEAGPLGCITTPWGGQDGYRPDAPVTTTLGISSVYTDHLIVSGTVYAADCVTPLAGALLEIWHTDANGSYEQSDFRARIFTDEAGHYAFTTMKPHPYLAYNQFIPAHIHYRVSYPGAPTVATQIFFQGDPVLRREVTSSIQRRLMLPLTVEEGLSQATFDVTLAVEPASSVRTE